MADCLKQARNFMLICEAALADMENSCQISQTTALAKIQSAAKSNRARAIYRAAQDAIVSVENENAFARQKSRLAGLLKQYQSGLCELEAYEGTSKLKSDRLTSAKAINTDISEPERCNSLSDTIRQDHAISAICSSLSFAKDDERPALRALISLSTQQKNTDLKNIFDPKNNIKTQIPDETKNHRDAIYQTDFAMKKTKEQISLEAIMPDVIQYSLMCARQISLTLSLSYDVGNVTLSKSELNTLTKRLKIWLGHLIKSIGSEVSEQRLSHIDFSIKNDCVILSTTSQALADSVLASENDAHLVSQNHNLMTGKLQLSLKINEKPQVIAAKSKTLPIEFGLADRLNALMTEKEPLPLSGIELPNDIEHTSVAAS